MCEWGANPLAPFFTCNIRFARSRRFCHEIQFLSSRAVSQAGKGNLFAVYIIWHGYDIKEQYWMLEKRCRSMYRRAYYFTHAGNIKGVQFSLHNQLITLRAVSERGGRY